MLPLANQPQVIQDPALPAAPALAVALLPDGRHVLTSGLDFHLRLWDLQESTCLGVWSAGDGKIAALDLSLDDRLALSASQDGTVHLWNLETGQVVRRVQTGGYLTGIAFSQDGTRACVGGEGGLSSWNLETGERIWHYPQAHLVAFSLSPDENTLVALARNNHLLAWRSR